MRMKQYRLDVFEPRVGQPEAVLRHRRHVYASDEQTAIERAMQMYRKFAASAQLERFVLYEDHRVVYEYRGPP